MSDYLSRVISRNIGSAISVQPRPLSLFEPWTATEGSALATSSQREMQDGSNAALLSSSFGANSGANQEGVTPASPQDVREGLRGIRFESENTHSPWLRTGKGFPGRGGTRSTDEAIPGMGQQMTSNSANSRPDGSRFEIAPFDSERLRVSDDAAMRATIMPVQRIDAGSVPSHSTLDGRLMTVQPGNAFSAVAQNGYTALSSNLPPTVHVTIGRVEIRATAAAVRVQPATPKSSVMNLEEFLRHREAGDKP